MVKTLPEARRATLYAEALVVAGHFGRTSMVPELLDLLGEAVKSIPDTEEYRREPSKHPLVKVLDTSLRALRRIGLRREISDLLPAAEGALERGLATAHARLAVAAGLAYLGDPARALPILDAARKTLNEPMTLTQRLDLTRALAQAYAQAPIG